MKRHFVIFCLLIISLKLQSQNLGTISGKIFSNETGLILEGATIQIENSNFFSITDENGYFQINNVPTSSYNITASFVGYKSLTLYNVIIKSVGNQSLQFSLDQSTEILDEVVVIQSPFKTSLETPLSTQTFSAIEIETYPGGNNDITRVIQSLPGISPSVGGFRNDIIIRGGGPNETVYYLDGIEIPNINHFSTQGSSGGPVGLINVSFIKDVTLSTSSFGAEYDNALSGVLSFEQKEANIERISGNFRIGSSEAGLTFEGPINIFNNKETSFIFSVRRSYLQFIFKAFGFSFLPDYWDYQMKIKHKIDDYNYLNFIGIGSIDELTVNESNEFNFENESTIEQIPIINQRSRTFGLSWKRIFKNKSGFFNLSISNNMLENNFERFQNNLSRVDPTFINISNEEETKIRFISTKNLKKFKFSYGGNFQLSDYINKYEYNYYNIYYNTKINFIKYGLFIKGSGLFLDDKLGISLGFRVDQDNFTLNNDFFENFSPRLALSFIISEDNKWKLNFSSGRYFKIPTYTSLGFKNLNNIFLNKTSKYTMSDHIVGGIEFNWSESSRLTLELFNKKYTNYPVSVLDGVSLANKGGDFEVLGNEEILTIGKGKSYGLEFLYQQKLKNNFYGILSYTLFYSKFSGLDKVYFPSVWDNRHILSFTGGYKLKKNWELSSKIRYTGKTPYAPVDIFSSVKSYPEIIFDYSKLGNYYLTEFTKLDIRIDKRWNFKSTSMNFYIDIENLLMNEIPIPPEYGLERDQNQNIVNPRNLIEVISDNRNSIIPSIGFVFDF
ncbi:MAG: TonB-dependent receptor [Candidatus Marisimplicoccus sp.]|tara:strand:+ start:832 stop:3183 length:2352 start_codon:yes stop_codon:yes gene_type:complete